MLALSLLIAATASAETPQYDTRQSVSPAAVTLSGTAITLASSEVNGLPSADVHSTLSYPFETVAQALGKPENWCQFMPLHFNIKGCTYETRDGAEVVTLYTGRKSYQTPSESHALVYRFETLRQEAGRLSLLLHADRGPVNTRDYRIEVEALRVKEGTRLRIHSSYRPSTASSLLTRTYLSTLGRSKIGFTHIEQEGELRPVQGVRGVIERNVMRYYLAIGTYLGTQQIPAASRQEAALKNWFKQNERYPQQLHEMTETEYLSIKRREHDNQRHLQQELNKKFQLAVTQDGAKAHAGF